MPMPRKRENHINIVYGLADPRTGHLRYIGQSRQGVRRIRAHLTPSALSRDSRLSEWLRGLVAEGLRPDGFIIEEHDDPDDIHAAEEFSIQYFRGLGCDLLNKVGGGRRQEGRGRWMTPDGRRRIAESNRRRVWSEASIEKQRRRGRSAGNLAHLQRVNEKNRKIREAP